MHELHNNYEIDGGWEKWKPVLYLEKEGILDLIACLLSVNIQQGVHILAQMVAKRSKANSLHITPCTIRLDYIKFHWLHLNFLLYLSHSL